MQLETGSTTKDTVQSYFQAINDGGWESYIADDVTLAIFSSAKEIKGKAAYVAATKRFFQVAKSVELLQLIVDGEKACALVRYKLQGPSGKESATDIAEVMSLASGKIKSNTIFFDTTSFSNFIAPFIALYYKEAL